MALKPDDRDSPDLLDSMALMRSAQELERTRLAWRLHDNVTQTLVAFRMQCYALEARLPERASEMQAGMSMLDEAIAVLREIAEDLRPSVLSFGIEAAIEWQAERFQAKSDIACVVDVATGGGTLDPQRAIELFRIFQQALANIALHSCVTTIDVSLRQEANDMLLEIRDDGTAPGPGRPMEYDLGILTMKERAQRAGGAFAMANSAIEIRMPLQR